MASTVRKKKVRRSSSPASSVIRHVRISPKPDSVSSSDDDNHVKCEICGKLLLVSTLQSHFETHNSNRTLYPCTVCDKKFTRFSTMRYHRAIHGIDAKYQCPKCDRGYVRRVELKRHLISYHRVTHPFKCRACDGEFMFVHSLKIHVQLVHGTEPPYRNYCGPDGTKEPRKTGKHRSEDGQHGKQLESIAQSGDFHSSTKRRRKKVVPDEDTGEDEDSDLDDDEWFRCLQAESQMDHGDAALDEDSNQSEASSSKSNSADASERQNVFSLFGHLMPDEAEQEPLSPPIYPHDDGSDKASDSGTFCGSDLPKIQQRTDPSPRSTQSISTVQEESVSLDIGMESAAVAEVATNGSYTSAKVIRGLPPKQLSVRVERPLLSGVTVSSSSQISPGIRKGILETLSSKSK